MDATHPLIKEHEERIRDFQSWTDSDIANEDINGHGTHATHLLLDVAPNADVYIARITEGSGSELDMAQRVAKVIFQMFDFHDIPAANFFLEGH